MLKSEIADDIETLIQYIVSLHEAEQPRTTLADTYECAARVEQWLATYDPNNQ